MMHGRLSPAELEEQRDTLSPLPGAPSHYRLGERAHHDFSRFVPPQATSGPSNQWAPHISPRSPETKKSSTRSAETYAEGMFPEDVPLQDDDLVFRGSKASSETWLMRSSELDVPLEDADAAPDADDSFGNPAQDASDLTLSTPEYSRVDESYETSLEEPTPSKTAAHEPFSPESSFLATSVPAPPPPQSQRPNVPAPPPPQSKRPSVPAPLPPQSQRPSGAAPPPPPAVHHTRGHSRVNSKNLDLFFPEPKDTAPVPVSRRGQLRHHYRLSSGNVNVNLSSPSSLGGLSTPSGASNHAGSQSLQSSAQHHQNTQPHHPNTHSHQNTQPHHPNTHSHQNTHSYHPNTHSHKAHTQTPPLPKLIHPDATPPHIAAPKIAHVEPRVPQYGPAWPIYTQMALGLALWTGARYANSLALTGLTYWMLFDASAALAQISAAARMRSEPRSLTHPFGLATLPVLFIFTLAAALLFCASYLCKELAEAAFLSEEPAPGSLAAHASAGHHSHHAHDAAGLPRAVQVLLLVCAGACVWNSLPRTADAPHDILGAFGYVRRGMRVSQGVVLGTAAGIVATQAIVDPAAADVFFAGVLVVLMIRVALSPALATARILLQGSPAPHALDELAHNLAHNPLVLDAHSNHLWQMGPDPASQQVAMLKLKARPHASDHDMLTLVRTVRAMARPVVGAHLTVSLMRV